MKYPWVWGIDPGARRCGVGMLSLETGILLTTHVEWHPAGLTAIAHGRSLRRAYHDVHRWASRQLEQRPPCAIAYEQPSGREESPTLMMHLGVTVAALATATDMTPWKLMVSEWKKVVLNSGAAPKTRLTDWAEHLGLSTDLDEVAGAAVAVAAAVTLYEYDATHLKLPL